MALSLDYDGNDNPSFSSFENLLFRLGVQTSSNKGARDFTARRCYPGCVQRDFGQCVVRIPFYLQFSLSSLVKIGPVPRQNIRSDRSHLTASAMAFSNTSYSQHLNGNHSGSSRPCVAANQRDRSKTSHPRPANDVPARCGSPLNKTPTRPVRCPLTKHEAAAKGMRANVREFTKRAAAAVVDKTEQAGDTAVKLCKLLPNKTVEMSKGVAETVMEVVGKVPQASAEGWNQIHQSMKALPGKFAAAQRDGSRQLGALQSGCEGFRKGYRDTMEGLATRAVSGRPNSFRPRQTCRM